MGFQNKIRVEGGGGTLFVASTLEEAATLAYLEGAPKAEGVSAAIAELLSHLAQGNLKYLKDIEEMDCYIKGVSTQRDVTAAIDQMSSASVVKDARLTNSRLVSVTFKSDAELAEELRMQETARQENDSSGLSSAELVEVPAEEALSATEQEMSQGSDEEEQF